MINLFILALFVVRTSVSFLCVFFHQFSRKIMRRSLYFASRSGPDRLLHFYSFFIFWGVRALRVTHCCFILLRNYLENLRYHQMSKASLQLVLNIQTCQNFYLRRISKTVPSKKIKFIFQKKIIFKIKFSTYQCMKLFQ